MTLDAFLEETLKTAEGLVYGDPKIHFFAEDKSEQFTVESHIRQTAIAHCGHLAYLLGLALENKGVENIGILAVKSLDGRNHSLLCGRIGAQDMVFDPTAGVIYQESIHHLMTLDSNEALFTLRLGSPRAHALGYSTHDFFSMIQSFIYYRHYFYVVQPRTLFMDNETRLNQLSVNLYREEHRFAPAHLSHVELIHRQGLSGLDVTLTFADKSEITQPISGFNWIYRLYDNKPLVGLRVAGISEKWPTPIIARFR